MKTFQDIGILVKEIEPKQIFKDPKLFIAFGFGRFYGWYLYRFLFFFCEIVMDNPFTFTTGNEAYKKNSYFEILIIHHQKHY